MLLARAYALQKQQQLIEQAEKALVSPSIERLGRQSVEDIRHYLNALEAVVTQPSFPNEIVWPDRPIGLIEDWNES